jgi:hypothetical protein
VEKKSEFNSYNFFDRCWPAKGESKRSRDTAQNVKSRKATFEGNYVYLILYYKCFGKAAIESSFYYHHLWVLGMYPKIHGFMLM